MSAPEPFAAMLKNVSGAPAMSARVRLDAADDLDARVADALAKIPAEGRTLEQECLVLLCGLDRRFDSIERQMAEMNIILARINGRFVTFLNTPSALECDRGNLSNTGAGAGE